MMKISRLSIMKLATLANVYCRRCLETLCYRRVITRDLQAIWGLRRFTDLVELLGVGCHPQAMPVGTSTEIDLIPPQVNTTSGKASCLPGHAGPF